MPIIRLINKRLERVKSEINKQEEKKNNLSCNDRRSAWFKKMKKTLDEIDDLKKG